MSFGFSVGDFVALIQLAKVTYKNCVEAGPEYNEIAREIRSLHSVLKPLRDEVDRPDSGIFKQDRASAEELRKSIDGCNHILDDLQILLAKYEGLSNAGEAVSSSKKLWHRLRFSTKIEQLAAVRAKLISYTSTISVLLDAVQLKATGRVENKIDNVSSQMAEGFESLKKVILDMAVKARAEQRGGSTLSLLSLSTYAGDDKDIWREFRRELIGMGFRSKSLDRHKDLLQAYMLKLDQSGVLDEVGASSGQNFMDPWWKRHAFSETVHTLPGPQVDNEKVSAASLTPSASGKIPTPPPPEYSVTDGNKSNPVFSLPSRVDQELADPNIGQSLNLKTINDSDMPDSKGKSIVTPPGATIPDLNLAPQTDSEESEKETNGIRRRRRPRVKRKSGPSPLNVDLTDSMVDSANRIASELPPISSEYEGNPGTIQSASMSSTDINPQNMNVDPRPVLLTTGSDLPTASQPKRNNIDMAAAQKAHEQRAQRRRELNGTEGAEEAIDNINTWLRESSETPLVAISQESERLAGSNSRNGDIKSHTVSPKARRTPSAAKPARPFPIQTQADPVPRFGIESRPRARRRSPRYTKTPARSFPIQTQSDPVPRFGIESQPQAQRRSSRDTRIPTTTSSFGAVAMGLAGLSLILGMRRRNKTREAREPVDSDAYYDYYSDSFTQTSDSDDSDSDNDSVRDLYNDGKRRGELFRRDNGAMDARSKQPTASATLRGNRAAQSDPDMSQDHSSSQNGGLGTQPLNAYLESASEPDSEARHVWDFNSRGSPHLDVESNPASGTITPRRKIRTRQATEAGPNEDDDRDTRSTETRAAVDKSGKRNEVVTSSEQRENLERRFVIPGRT